MGIGIKIIWTFLAVLAGILIVNIVNANKRRLSMSFRESLDLTDLPIITFRQGKEKINLILDTGSSKSVIIPEVLDR